MDRAMRTVIYTRVSTTDQTIQPQLIELRGICLQRGWTITAELTDTISGAKDTREGLNKLMDLITTKAVDTLLVVKLDRLCRSLSHFGRMCDLLKKQGVALVIPGQGIDTTKNNPCGEMQLGVLAVIAQFERSLISERTKAGLVAARARGKTLGRPSVLLPPPTERRQIVFDWRTTGRPGGFVGLGKLLGGVSAGTAWRQDRATPPEPPLEVEL